jgi:hypothetical protein
MTEYVVMQQDDSGYWTELAREEARSDTAAIRSYLNGKSLHGKYVAVPVRSFRVRQPKEKTTTIISFQ